MQPLDYETPSAGADPAVLRRVQHNTIGACIFISAAALCIAIAPDIERASPKAEEIMALLFFVFLLLAWACALLGIIRSVTGIRRCGNSRGLWVMLGICGVIVVLPLCLAAVALLAVTFCK